MNLDLSQFNAVPEGRLGWVCARCSRSLAPEVRECPCSPSGMLPPVSAPVTTCYEHGYVLGPGFHCPGCGGMADGGRLSAN